MNIKNNDRALVLQEAREAREKNQIDLALEKYHILKSLKNINDEILYEIAIYYGQLGKPKDAVPLFRSLAHKNKNHFNLNFRDKLFKEMRDTPSIVCYWTDGIFKYDLDRLKQNRKLILTNK